MKYRFDTTYFSTAIPDSKVHGANMGPIWARQDSGGPHVGPINFAIWDTLCNVSKRFDIDNHQQ